MDSSIHRILESAAIERVLTQYASACDQRDWPALESVFAPDVTANYGGEFELAGREDIINMIRNMLGGCGPTQHLLGNCVIDVDDHCATSACYVRAVHAGTGENENTFYEVWAQYRDALEKTAQGWRITHRQMIVSKEVGSRSILKPQS